MDKPLTSIAQFINRGEQFFVIDASTRYVGECVWFRDRIAGSFSPPTYPVKIFVRSIRRAGLAGVLPLSQAKRLRIAHAAKQLLEAREQGCLVELVED